jgi:SRSO17 transposase
MLNVISTIPPSLEKFLGEFKDLFIEPQFENFKVYSFGLQLELKRTNIQTINECRPKSNYDSLHHFLTNSPWNEEKVNSRRIEIIQRDRRTRSCPDGSLVIDDVACKKSKSATKIEAAKVQYAGSEKGLVNCNVAVTSYYVDKIRDFPVNLEPYVPADEFEEGEDSPDFFTKIELGKKLVLDAIEKGIQFKEGLIDNWYLCSDFVSFLEIQGKDWISTLKSNDVIYRLSKKRRIRKKKKHRTKKRRREFTVEKLVNSLLPSCFQEMTKVYKDGKEEKRYIWGANFRVQSLGGTQRIVISKPDPYTKDIKRIDVYVTNNLSLKDKEIVYHFSQRWRTEDFNRDAKDNLAFDQYQVRTLKAIKRHWYSVFIAHSFLMCSKLKGSFQRILKANLNTVGDLLRAFRKINFLHFLRWLKNHYNVFRQYLCVKEPIFA